MKVINGKLASLAFRGRGDLTRTGVCPLGRSACSQTKKRKLEHLHVVGATWLEQATSASQTQRATNCATPRIVLLYHIFQKRCII